MEIVVGSLQFGVLGGLETYVITIAEQLQALAHGVTVVAVDGGPATTLATERGLDVRTGEEELADACDVVIANDAISAYRLADRYPRAPLVFVVHADEYELAMPPQIPEVVQAAVVLHDRVARRVGALAHVPEIVRLRQPIDTKRFFPRTPLNDPPVRALLLGNWVQGDRRDLVFDVCRDAGIECEHIGFHSGSLTTEPEIELCRADIVFGKARVVLEAMASGRAAYVYDHNGGDGWVTPDRYELLEADNFGGQAEPTVVDGDRLRRDLAAFTPAMGPANRDLAIAHHSANRHAQALVELCRRIAPREAQPPAPLRELARLTRLAWANEWRAAHWAREAQRLLGERSAFERARAELDHARTELDHARTELEHARAELHDAARETRTGRR